MPLLKVVKRVEIPHHVFAPSAVAAPTWTKKVGPAIGAGGGGSSVTFTSQAINNSSSSDTIIVMASSHVGNVSGVTIGGDAMTQAVQGDNGTNGNFALSIWYKTGATYTTPNIVVSGSGMTDVGMTAGILTGVTAAPSGSPATKPYGFTGDPQTTSSALTIPSTGFGIVVACSETPGAGATWNVGTEDYDISSAGWLHTSGFISTSGSQTPSISGFSFAGCGIAAAAWGP